MLALTTNALEVVRSISAADDTPDGGGLRIALPQGSEPEELELSVADGPQQDDEVLSGEGATVFVDPGAAEFLADKVLDAQVDDEGMVTFAVAEQPSED